MLHAAGLQGGAVDLVCRTMTDDDGLRRFPRPSGRPGADPRVKKKRERPQVSLSSFPDFLAISRHDQNDTKKAELAS